MMIDEEKKTGYFFGEIFGFNTEKVFDESIKLISLKQFFDYDVKGKIVADIGCGYGRTSYELLSAGAKKVFAIDFSAKQLDRTRRNCQRHGLNINRLETIKESATSLVTIRNNLCDVVVSLGVIHHLPDFDSGLESLCRITAKGGTIFFATLGKKGIIPFLRRSIRVFTKLIPYRWVHPLLNMFPLSSGWKYTISDTFWAPIYHMHSIAELEAKFRKYGCEIVKVSDVYKENSSWFRFLQGEGYIHVQVVKQKDHF